MVQYHIHHHYHHSTTTTTAAATSHLALVVHQDVLVDERSLDEVDELERNVETDGHEVVVEDEEREPLPHVAGGG